MKEEDLDNLTLKMGMQQTRLESDVLYGQEKQKNSYDAFSSNLQKVAKKLNQENLVCNLD